MMMMMMMMTMAVYDLLCVTGLRRYPIFVLHAILSGSAETQNT